MKDETLQLLKTELYNIAKKSIETQYSFRERRDDDYEVDRMLYYDYRSDCELTDLVKQAVLEWVEEIRDAESD